MATQAELDQTIDELGDSVRKAVAERVKAQRDLAAARHDAKCWQERGERAEAERALAGVDLAEARAEFAEFKADLERRGTAAEAYWQERAETMEAERDEARAEAARLEELLVACQYPCTCDVRPNCGRCNNVDAVMRKLTDTCA